MSPWTGCGRGQDLSIRSNLLEEAQDSKEELRSHSWNLPLVG